MADRAGNEDELRIQVCYAEPARQVLHELILPVGATITDALMKSGIAERLPAAELEACKVGIYGKLKTRETVLRDRDRVEIYRPLQADPKDARRRRAEKKTRNKV